ncbi:hypothetical protein [Pengzhenrongella sicca]|uniref:Uncharacterized protein n=1 Tax=Pengzhenrongella sicca TaxID=2819238 RepID=A0A8A4ZIG3_9MICO|nr:hypothetical protein [Pengzhenrongella sicca]QTE31055.1 hypothetical protein J4E96_09110 [Pengzhenrongella sicca]
MNKRTASTDLFLIEVATGETTLQHEQTDPMENVLLDQDGSPVFSIHITEDGLFEFSAIDRRTGARVLLDQVGGAECPEGVPPQLVTPDGTPRRLAGAVVHAVAGGRDGPPEPEVPGYYAESSVVTQLTRPAQHRRRPRPTLRRHLR